MSTLPWARHSLETECGVGTTSRKPDGYRLSITIVNKEAFFCRAYRVETRCQAHRGSASDCTTGANYRDVTGIVAFRSKLAGRRRINAIGGIAVHCRNYRGETSPNLALRMG